MTETSLPGNSSKSFSHDARRKSPTRVLSASFSDKVGVVIGLPASGYAAVWLFLVPNTHYYSWPSEIGTLCALLCAVVLFVFCWAAIFAYVVRKRNWSPKMCNLAGAPFLLMGCYFLVVDWFGHPPYGIHGSFAVMSMSMALAVTGKCQRLAYPDITGKQFYGAEPRPPGIF